MNEAVSLASRVRIPEGILARLLGDELVLLNLQTGVYFSLNQVGTRIWQLLETRPSRPLRTVLETLTDEYEVDRDRCRQDLLNLVSSLREHRLLDVSA